MFTGKNAIVTGGSRGIGRAIALALARHHARVAVFYAGNETAAKETAAFAAEAGGEIRTARCDVSDAASVKQACGALQEEWGGIDFLINCAGITRDGLMMRMKDEDFVPDDPRLCGDDGQAPLWKNYQYLIGFRSLRQCRSGQLLGCQGRNDRPDQIGRPGTGGPGNHLQCHCPRLY